jgi:hypothetical protein
MVSSFVFADVSYSQLARCLDCAAAAHELLTIGVDL